MEKKKLLFINGHLNTGGVEKALIDVLSHLNYEKYEVDLLLTEKLGDYATQLPPQVNILLDGLECAYGSFSKVIRNCVRRRDLFSLKMRLVFLMMHFSGKHQIRLAKKLLTGGKKYDCVIGFRRGFCTQIAAYAVNADLRITWWHHGSVNVDTKEYLTEVSNCEKIVAVSEGCRRMLIDAMPSLENRLITINNMLDADVICQKAEEFQPYAQNDGLHIVSVGRLAEEKHFENAIYVARQLKDQGVAFKWHLVGDGEMRETLYQKAKDMDVTDCFVFEGNKVNPYPYIKHADLFVHPSYVESFGLVVTEALALGVPCVATKNTGVMEFLKDGENALLTEQSPESLAEKVQQVIRDRKLYDRIKNNAVCPSDFLPEAVMQKIENLFDY